MAGVEAERMAKGPFSRLARTQYAALMAMRWQAMTHSLRSTQGLFELGAQSVAFLTYAVMGVGLAAGLAFASYTLVSHGNWTILPIIFWGVFFLWQTMPVALASFQQQFDMSGLLRFPVSFSAFLLLYVVFGLADIATLLGGLCCAGVLVGVTLARPELLGWIVLVLAGFALFNVLMVRVVLVWMDRWLAKRRSREIVSALFVLLLLGAQLLNPALYERDGNGKTDGGAVAVERRAVVEELSPWVDRMSALQEGLPPGLAVVALHAANERRGVRALGAAGALGLYLVAAGALLAVRLRAEYRGENLSESLPQKAAVRAGGEWLPFGGGPIAAVMEKELHTLMRAMPLLYMIGAPVFMVLVLGALFRQHSGVPGHPFYLALPLCVAYALLGPAQMVYNNLGAEGQGIQLLFLSPTPVRTVLLAKNLFHALVYCLTALLAGILATILLGWPKGAVLAATVAWLLFALPANLAVGNVFSLSMPHRMNLSRIMRQRGSAASALLSMFVQLLLLMIAASVFALCLYAERLWLAVPLFLMLAGGAVFVWLRVLRNSDGMANQRRDLLIGTLAKVE